MATSNLFSTVANYSGRQPDIVQNIKQFVTDIQAQAVLIIQNILNTGFLKKFITIIPTNLPVLIQNDLHVENDLYVGGIIINSSDINIKNNITKISNKKMDILLELNPIQYSFKSKLEDDLHYGFIAQEVEQYFPELIKTNHLNNKTINYIEIIPLLLLKIKELENKVIDLKNEIKELKNKA